MKKHKIDIMKSINNKKIITSKVLKGVIEMEEFNRVKIDWRNMVKKYEGGIGVNNKLDKKINEKSN
jgi:hypothetical protein